MQRKKVLQDLSEFISIQSVSADSKRFQEIIKAVSFLKTKLIKLGCTVSTIGEPNKPPVIIAEKKVTGSKQTIGIYGHYDVQSEDPVSEWGTDPFKLVNSKGQLVARGVADNKGHVIQNLAAIEELITSKKLQSNIVFVFEGEEEVGSEQFEKLVSQQKKLLSKVNVFFITDVGMYDKQVPQIIYSLRGLLYFEIEVSVGKTDLHSGVYGNAVLNPIQVLSELFSRMKNVESGEVQIKGFYDKVRKMDKKEKSLLAKSSIPNRDFQKEMKSYSTASMRGVPSYLAPKIFPSMDLHGIVAGYIGEGAKTVIPKKATAKFSFRLVEHQDINSIEKNTHDFIRKNMPIGVKYSIKMLSKDEAFYTSINDKFIQKTAEMLSEHFKHETILMREGGSIPAAEILQRLFKIPIILTGFVLPGCNLHAPNENFDEELFWEGIEALKKIYSAKF